MADSFKNEGVSAVRINEESPGMWQGVFHEYQPFGRVSKYVNEFTDWVADAWTITEVGTSLQVLTDQRNGVLRLTSGGTENDGSNCQLGGTGDGETVGECFTPEAGKNLWFEIRVKSDDVTEHDFFVGLHIQDTAVIASLGADYIGFMTDDGDAFLDFRNSSGSAVSVETNVHTLVNDTWVTLGFKVTGVSKIEFYVNNNLKGEQTTNITTGLMKLTIAQLTGESNAASLDVDYVAVVQDR